VVERVVFALVANRALAPSSKLAATWWIAHDVHLPGLTGGDYRVSDDACYRAMDGPYPRIVDTGWSITRRAAA
jgi:hypothetical protein